MNNNNIFNNLFQSNSEKQSGNSKFIQNNNNDEIDHNEERILYKLTLRKAKIQKAIFDKRGAKSLSNVIDLNFDNTSKELDSEDILSGVFTTIWKRHIKKIILMI